MNHAVNIAIYKYGIAVFPPMHFAVLYPNPEKKCVRNGILVLKVNN